MLQSDHHYDDRTAIRASKKWLWVEFSSGFFGNDEVLLE
jgi:hypothetical protein